MIMADDAVRMNRYSLRFADPALEAVFVEDQVRRALWPARVGALGGFVAVFGFWALLNATTPQVPNARGFFFLPSLAIMAILALSYAATYTQGFLRFYAAGAVMIMGAIAAVFAWVVDIAPPTTVMLAGILILMVVHTLNGYNLLRLRFPAAVACGWLGMAIYLGGAQALVGDHMVRSLVALFFANMFGMLSAYQLDLYARREFVARRENERLIDEVREKSAQLETASRHKSEFLANMSHELRTPLNAILGFSEVLIEKMFGAVNDKQLDYLKDINSSGQHLLSLINDILDLSKIEAGKMELQASDFDLPAALKTAVALVKERAQGHAIQLSLEIAPGLETIHADERKFKQIMLNLLSNAVKFTPDGGSICVKAQRDGAMVEISVTDTGAGIAPQDHAAVFEEFRQVGNDSARKAEGTGLGMPLTKRFVELHGGEIRLKSVLGKGSAFIFTLPFNPCSD